MNSTELKLLEMLDAARKIDATLIPRETSLFVGGSSRAEAEIKVSLVLGRMQQFLCADALGKPDYRNTVFVQQMVIDARAAIHELSRQIGLDTL